MCDLTLASERTLHGNDPFATHLDSVMIFDARSGRCIAANAAAIRSYGYSHAEFMRLTAETLCAPGSVSALADTGGGDRRKTSTTTHRRRDGSIVDVDETVLDFSWNDAPVSVLFATDVTQRVQAERDLRESLSAYALVESNARRDLLTGLANRLQLHEQLAAICSNSVRNSSRAAILILGLDSFKRVNDTLGHSAGDLVLQSVAALLRVLFGDADLVARSGGDEFVIVLNGAAPADAVTAACKIIYALAKPLDLAGRDLAMSASIGIACYPENGTHAESLLRNAATAMHRAKRTDRGSFRIFEESMRAAAVRRFSLESGLRETLQRGDLLVHYQPVVTIDGTLIGSEALVRWQRHGRLVSAAEFVPIAEETGLVSGIDAFVLTEACRQNASWQRRGRRLRISVNVSAHTIGKPDFSAGVRAALRDSGLNPALLELELTESALQSDLVGTARKVAEVRALGVNVALDDFGTGYNSLSILRSCRFDTVKLDRTFVSEIMTHDADSIITEAVIVASHRLGARVVAEGVETEQQRATLAALRCDDAQGYLFGAALPPADFSTLFGAPGLLPTIRKVA